MLKSIDRLFICEARHVKSIEASIFDFGGVGYVMRFIDPELQSVERRWEVSI